jgi:hypothetical protein
MLVGTLHPQEKLNINQVARPKLAKIAAPFIVARCPSGKSSDWKPGANIFLAEHI